MAQYQPVPAHLGAFYAPHLGFRPVVRVKIQPSASILAFGVNRVAQWEMSENLRYRAEYEGRAGVYAGYLWFEDESDAVYHRLSAK